MLTTSELSSELVSSESLISFSNNSSSYCLLSSRKRLFAISFYSLLRWCLVGVLAAASEEAQSDFDPFRSLEDELRTFLTEPLSLKLRGFVTHGCLIVLKSSSVNEEKSLE